MYMYNVYPPVYMHAHTGELLPIRLRDGPSDQEGRVEVYYNGTWGTICDDYWDLRDATVACRQLGFVEAITAESFAHFGSGIGECVFSIIWVRNYIGLCNLMFVT